MDFGESTLFGKILAITIITMFIVSLVGGMWGIILLKVIGVLFFTLMGVFGLGYAIYAIIKD